MAKQYESVIGLEVHIELATKTKIFCGCPAEFGREPNTHVCPVCTGMPGALPVLNRSVADYALALGAATHCQINKLCRFDRKNYFYPDNPQNYQISQLYLPICHDGWIEIEGAHGRRRIRIHEMHMEEDAGKLVHDAWEDSSLVDFNRSGVPLIEIVSEPDLRNASEVIAYLEKLRSICRYLGISDCKLQEGSMRADVNLSVRESGSKTLGVRTEMKNLNSFKAITRAIAAEQERQIELLEKGKAVLQETRRWDDNKEYSYAMRSKEDARDYRYFPDPDLPPIAIDGEWISRIYSEQPEMQEQKIARYIAQYPISFEEARLLTDARRIAELFEKTAALCGQPKKVANWLIGETIRLLKEYEMEAEDVRISPEHLAGFIQLVENGDLNNQNAKKVFEAMFAENTEPQAYMEACGLKTVTDIGLLEKTVDRVLIDHPKTVEEYKSGKTKVLGFLVGQVMKHMRGKADPAAINRLISERLAD